MSIFQIGNKKVGLGILSYKSRKTTENTLKSYKKQKFFEIFHKNIIYFNDISKEDIYLANKYNIKFSGGKNVGVLEGMRKIIENLSDMDYIIFLQQDHPLVENKDKIVTEIQEGLNLLEANKADIIRLRSRFKAGEGLIDTYKYLKYYGLKEIDQKYNDYTEQMITKKMFSDNIIKKIRRFFRPKKAQRMKSRSIYIEKNPDLMFPDVIKKEKNFYIIDSSIINFSEQPFLISQDFMKKLFNYADTNPAKRVFSGFQVFEVILNCKWWRNSHFKIATSDGIFTHRRYDRDNKREMKRLS